MDSNQSQQPPVPQQSSAHPPHPQPGQPYRPVRPQAPGPQAPASPPTSAVQPVRPPASSPRPATAQQPVAKLQSQPHEQRPTVQPKVIVAQSPHKRRSRKPFVIAAAVLLALVLAGAVFANKDRLPFAKKSEVPAQKPATGSAAYVPKAPSADEALFPASDSEKVLTTRLADLQATINSQTNDLSWEKASSTTDSRNGKKKQAVWCKRSAPNTTQTNCEIGSGGSLGGELGQKVILETYEALTMISFHNRYQDYNFTYVEHAPNDDNRFSLLFQDKNMPSVVASRISVDFSLPNVELDKTNAVQASASSKRSLKEELNMYLASADSLKEYAQAQLQALQAHAQDLIKKDGVKKYTDCRKGQDVKEECFLQKLSDKEKAQLTKQVTDDITKKRTSVDTNYQAMYDALVKASFAKECPGCWR